jgi:hypothetical protein
VSAAPPTLDAIPVGVDETLSGRLAREGRAAYRVELRAAARRRTRLQSAKILDGAGAFVCEAIIQDFSAAGLRLMLARNCGLPSRFGVHIDLTGELLTAAPAWRRDRVVGARVIAYAPPAPLKTSDRLALAGRYYGVRG